jgi:hypothetical protein
MVQKGKSRSNKAASDIEASDSEEINIMSEITDKDIDDIDTDELLESSDEEKQPKKKPARKPAAKKAKQSKQTKPKVEKKVTSWFVDPCKKKLICNNSIGRTFALGPQAHKRIG